MRSIKFLSTIETAYHSHPMPTDRSSDILIESTLSCPATMAILAEYELLLVNGLVQKTKDTLPENLILSRSMSKFVFVSRMSKSATDKVNIRPFKQMQNAHIRKMQIGVRYL